MATIANLAVALTARTQGFQQQMRGVNATIQKMRATVAGFAGGLFAVVGTFGLGALVKGSLDAADRVAKLSRTLGLSTEFLSKLRFIASQTGSDFEQLARAILKQQQVIGYASQGQKTYVDLFDALNLKISDLIELSPEEQFYAIVDALGKMENVTQRNYIGTQIFGRAFLGMGTILEGGSEQLRKLGEEAEKTGQIFTKDMTDKAEAANDALDRMKKTLGGLIAELVIKAAPGIEAFANKVTTLLQPIADLIGNIVSGIGRFIGGLAAFGGQAFKTIQTARLNLQHAIFTGELSGENFAGKKGQGVPSFFDVLKGGEAFKETRDEVVRLGSIVEESAGELVQSFIDAGFNIGEIVQKLTPEEQVQEQKATNKILMRINEKLKTRTIISVPATAG